MARVVGKAILLFCFSWEWRYFCRVQLVRRKSSNRILMLAALKGLPSFQLAAATFSHGYKTFPALKDLCVSFSHCIFNLLELWARHWGVGGGGQVVVAPPPMIHVSL